MCKEGFGGAACTIDLNAPPTLTTKPPIKICDQKDTQCASDITIFGQNILDSDNLTCHFKQVMVSQIGLDVINGFVILVFMLFMRFQSKK